MALPDFDGLDDHSSSVVDLNGRRRILTAMLTLGPEKLDWIAPYS